MSAGRALRRAGRLGAIVAPRERIADVADALVAKRAKVNQNRTLAVEDSVAELFGQYPLVPRMAFIKQQRDFKGFGLPDGDMPDGFHFIVVGNRVDRSLFLFEDFNVHDRTIGQQGTAPPAWPERADRRQRQKRRIKRKDRTLRREIIGSRAGRRGGASAPRR